MDLQQIEKLVQIIENSSMLEFSIQEGDTKIKMSRRGTMGVPGEAAVTVAQTAPAAPLEEDAEDETYITSPIVGTFYSAPSPEAKAFVKVGDRVKAGQTVCILEAMKLMNDVVAACSGTVAEVLVKDGDLVEYGQPLFVIEG